MRSRSLLGALLLCLAVGGCAWWLLRADWNPTHAAAQAQKDVRAGHVKFYFCGGFAPVAPGVPMMQYAWVRRYPQAVASSDLGCSGSTQQ